MRYVSSTRGSFKVRCNVLLEGATRMWFEHPKTFDGYEHCRRWVCEAFENDTVVTIVNGVSDKPVERLRVLARDNYRVLEANDAHDWIDEDEEEAPQSEASRDDEGVAINTLRCLKCGVPMYATGGAFCLTCDPRA